MKILFETLLQYLIFYCFVGSFSLLIVDNIAIKVKASTEKASSY